MSRRGVSRRSVLRSGGGLLIAFQIAAPTAAPAAEKLPGSLAANPSLDAWLRFSADGAITLLTGKVELGQGVLTALAQIAADELDVPLPRIRVISGDTALTPNEGPTAGSFSMPEGGMAVRYAAAEARHVLLGLAAARMGVPSNSLRTAEGQIIAPDGRRAAYADLLAGRALQRRATGSVTLRPAENRRHIGRSDLRLDLPAKVSGEAAFLHDHRPPGMVHGRVLRPPSRGAVLLEPNAESVRAMPGVLAVVRDGSFLGVIAVREDQAAAALAELERVSRWREADSAETERSVFAWMKVRPAEDIRVLETPRMGRTEARRAQATYRRPFIMHGSIGPSVAIGLLDGGSYTIQTHSQSVFETAAAIAQMLGVPLAQVRLQHMQGAGCYGHNGADDAAADAALLARAFPGRPVRVQWSRADEHRWEPYGSAMQIELQAGVDANGDVLDWRCDLWSMPHSTRPAGAAGNLLAAQALGRPFPPPPPRVIPAPSYGPDRNAIPAYVFPTTQITTHFVRESPVRVSSLRSLGAHGNVFAIESFMDELAHAAGVEPLAYRLRRLADPRAAELLTRTAEAFGWARFQSAPGRGRGLAFARYKNLAAYCAVCLETDVDRASGQMRVIRATAGVDAGAAVNPDGLRNQIEGGLLQALSWSLKEEVRFAGGRVLSSNWAEYPILTFSEAPPVDVIILDRPDAAFLGAGEAAQGPTSAALANAIFDATGLRVRHLPFTPRNVLAAAARD